MILDLSGNAPRIDFNDPALNLTAAQAEAMDLTQERMVSAGAGSGKTWTLSLRYTALLLHEAWRSATQAENAAIDTALVLTFTAKAAQEMGQRCNAQLLNLITAVGKQQSEIEAKWGPGLADRLWFQLNALGEQFERARIGTFHSFCTQLLREEGLKIGLNPTFRLLDELESQSLAREAVQAAYAAWRKDVPVLGFSATRHCFNGRTGLEDTAIRFLRNRSKFEDIPLNEQQPGTLLKALIAEAPLSFAQVRDWLSTEGLPILKDLDALIAPADPTFRKKVLLPAIQSVDLSTECFLTLNQAYATVLQAVCTVEEVRTLSHFSVLGSKKLWKENGAGDRYVTAKAELQDLRAGLSHWPGILAQSMNQPKPTDEMADALNAALSDLFHRTTQALEALHKQRNVLDFDGLQIHCLRLLRNDKGLCERLFTRHRFVMVDEFQDTDAIQWEILRRIGRSPDQAENHLFAVGDLKQAIYSFRGGDVSVFTEARKALKAETVLDRNFRSRHAIVDFTNQLFSLTMGPECPSRPAWEAHYSPVEAGRDTKQIGRVALVRYTRTHATANAAEEGRLTALLCQQLLDPKGPFSGEQYGDPSAHPNPPIAILLRRRTHFGRTQAALVAAGIPFQVAKGVGFWNQAEVRDLLQGLTAALTGDPIALVGFLRSPLACASDPEIQGLAEGQWGPIGFQSFSHNQLAPEAPLSLRLAQQTLGAILEKAAFSGLRALCEWLIAETAADRAWALSGELEKSRANVQKLLDWMSQIEHRGWSHTRCLRFFNEQILSARREPEADDSRHRVRVVLQTVHGAKGLEFPVIILGGLETQSDPPSTFGIGPGPSGWAFATKTPDPTARIHKRIDNVRSYQLQQRRLLEKEAEDLRLFYVALTRAEDHLFFIGDPDKCPKGSWMKHLMTCDQALEAWNVEGEPAAEKAAIEVPATPSVPIPHLPAFRPAEVSTPIRISASGLQQHRVCPIQWRLRQALPAVPGFHSEKNATIEAAALRGTVLHGLLERKSLCAKKGALAWAAASAGLGWPESVLKQQGDRLSADLSAMAKDAQLGQMLGPDSVAEASFQIPIHGMVLKGQIDLLWREAGEWVLTDFKSGSIRQDPDSLLQHKAQLTAYAWAASRLLGSPITRTEIYSTRKAQRMPLPDLTAADFTAHEAHLQTLSVDSSMSIPDLQDKVLSLSQERPCGDCRFNAVACPGRIAN